MNFETENIEFKSGYTNEIYKEIIAFANTNGGILYIGIDNAGNAIALKPSGVFVRQGTSSVPASPEHIRHMIKDSDGDTFEEMRSINQELTFDAAVKAFKKYSVEFAEDKYLALGLTNKSDRLYTNLALILSDQCAHTTKVAVFGDETNTTFRDNREFKGSVFIQLEDTYNYLMLSNKTTATFKGLERIEKQDYPEEAMREALLNAIVHRDYGFSGSIIINVNDKEMEFISIGGLLPGLSPEDIRSGISQPRNRKLAEVFHRLHLIESYGTGIRKIYSLYSECSAQPRIEVTMNTFKIVLPNMNNAHASEKPEEISPMVTSQMKAIMNHITEHGQITDEEIQDLLTLKKTRAFTLAKQMRELGLIYVDGRGVNKRYRLK